MNGEDRSETCDVMIVGAGMAGMGADRRRKGVADWRKAVQRTLDWVE